LFSRCSTTTYNVSAKSCLEAAIENFSGVNLLDRITIRPGRRSGKPCVRETRITVYDVLGYLAAGTTEAELLSEFPDLTHENILACFAFAAERDRRTFVSHAA